MLNRLLPILALLTLAACASAPGTTPTAAVAAPAAPKGFDSKPGPGTEAHCPVSGEKFTVADDTEGVEHKGKHYVFCCPGCAGEFNGDPAHYADK